MTSVVAKWQSLSKKEKTDDEEKKTKAEEQTENKNEVPGNNIYDTHILCILISPLKQRVWPAKTFDRLFFFMLSSC